MVPRQRSLFIITFGIALCFSISNPTPASQLIGWWVGNWTCNINGRSAQMKWISVDAGVSMCDDNGNNCITSDRLHWKGGFSDNGSRWVQLTNPREGKKGGFSFVTPMAINGIYPNPMVIKPLAGQRGMVSAIRCHVGDK